MNRAEELYSRIVEVGEAEIDELIASRASEELFLDFKRSSDDGQGARLSQIDRNNLAKAISGFGNSSGGVLVWGVDCSPDRDGADVARAKRTITNVRRFVANLQGVVSGCTIPPHAGVQHSGIIVPGSDDGFVATYIPESENAPHQVVGKQQYYIRAGSDFVPAPHQVLAGMFGRRPQPHVYQMFTYSPPHNDNDTLVLEVGIMATNGGPGIARDIFITATGHDLVGDLCRISWELLDPNWSGSVNFSRIINIISHEGLRLPPSAFLTPLALRIELRPPITENLKIEANIGCSGSPTTKFFIENSPEGIAAGYQRYFELLEAGRLTQEEKHAITASILNNQID